MESDWVRIYISNNFFQAELVKQLLTQHDMEVVLMNKQDSAHKVFGQIEVYIHKSAFGQAIEVMLLNDINP